MTTPRVVTTEADLAETLAQWRAQGQTVGFVPTMGSLHAGHLALADRARTLSDRVVLSIFVNPSQFGVGEDFEKYPRDLDGDVRAVSGGLVDVVFAPGVPDVYPAGYEGVTPIAAGPLGDVFEGVSRPGHFDGVVTVVNRLCEMVAPDVVVLGHKDAQQLFLVTAMVARRGAPWTVEGVDIVRDTDGVALSSRNSFLAPEERVSATALFRALGRAAQQSSAAEALAVARETLESTPLVEVDYVALVDPATFEEVATPHRGGFVRMIIAARVGQTRLIDNEVFSIPQ